MSIAEAVSLMIDEEYSVIEALKEQHTNITEVILATSYALKKCW